MNGFVTDHVELVSTVGRCYKFVRGRSRIVVHGGALLACPFCPIGVRDCLLQLAFWEADAKRRIAMLQRRVDMLQPILVSTPSLYASGVHHTRIVVVNYGGFGVGCSVNLIPASTLCHTRRRHWTVPRSESSACNCCYGWRVVRPSESVPGSVCLWPGWCRRCKK